ncbi:MAG: helical backbone metal receptor [Bacteroidota bacterium]
MAKKITLKCFTDQMQRVVRLPVFPPRKIISLVPSITELLFDLGLDDQIAGVTKFCIHPKEKCKSKIIIGGTKNIHQERINEINPDLIIANKEENEKSQIKLLEKSFPVWMSDVDDFSEAIDMISKIGEITGKENPAQDIVRKIHTNFSKIVVPARKYKVAYLIWQKPYMTVGGDTFIHSMLQKAGFENVFKNEKRYPEISLENIVDRQTEILFLSTEPYPFKEKHTKEFERLLPGIKIILVDGEMFSWYGSRMMISTEYFMELQTYCTKAMNS